MWLAWRKSVGVLIACKAKVAGLLDQELMKAAARKVGMTTKLSVEGR